MDWVHDNSQIAPLYMTKVVVNLKLEGKSLWTMPLTRLVGQHEDISGSPKKSGKKATNREVLVSLKDCERRKKIINSAPDSLWVGDFTSRPEQSNARLNSPSRVSAVNAQKLVNNPAFVHEALSTLAVAAYKALPERFKQCGAYLYDPTILYNSTWTPDHVDEPKADGPGHCIVNYVCSGTGWLIFCGEKDPDPFYGMPVFAGMWTMFTDDMLYKATHQVLLMEEKPLPLAFNEKLRPETRVVVTFRFGICPPEWIDMHEIVFAPAGAPKRVSAAGKTPKPGTSGGNKRKGGSG